jgi:aspartyl-tRNA(Asn)/glutamyl-tRNA(Gln) amidotransferase subunit A
MIELTRIHAHHMAARLRRGEVSSRELTEAHLDVAERQNDRLNAWLSIDRERALAEADRADARLRDARAAGAAAVAALHPMLGIPVALKDLVSVEGGQCTAGSLILKGYRAPYDAHITERLRDVGAVILGKTNMDEFAMGSSTEHSAYGPTANPWALERGLGGRGGCVPRTGLDRHGHRWLHPAAGRVDRDRRPEAHLRACEPVRHRGLCELARPDRAVRPGRPRCRGAAARHRGS